MPEKTKYLIGKRFETSFFLKKKFLLKIYKMTGITKAVFTALTLSITLLNNS